MAKSSSLDLSIGGWLAVGFGMAALLFLAFVTVSTVFLARIGDLGERQMRVFAPRADAAERLEIALLYQAIALRAAAVDRGEQSVRTADRAAARVTEALAHLPEDADAAADLAQVAELVERYELGAAQLTALLRTGAVPSRVSGDVSALARVREELLIPLRAYAGQQHRRAAEASADIDALRRRMKRTVLAASAILLVLLGATGLLVARAVRRPAKHLVAAARRLSAGDYDAVAAMAGAPQGVTFRNELAELSSAFGRAAVDLRDREERLAAQNEELQVQQEELQAQHEELQAQNEELQAQADQLQAQDDRLRDSVDAIARSEARYRELSQTLQDADERKDEFLAVLSHELRNPLGPVLSSLHVLDRAEPGSEQARRARAVIRRQVAHLARLVDDLLDVTRITRGKVRLQRMRVDLGALVRQAAEDNASLLTGKGLDLDVAVPEAELWIDADPARIAQIVGNLLQNAAKFTESGGRVALAVEPIDGDRAVAVRVRDTGIGIAPEVMDRLFEPFVQAESSLARTRGGLGLGLALVKGFVELHGGVVRAASSGEGHGSEFRVELPLDRSPAPDVRAPARSSVSKKRRLLLIDDNADAADSLREALEMAGHAVDVALDGREGLRMARELRPEVVLCDIGLPVMDGYEFARRLRADLTLRDVFLVALTGYALPDDLRRAEEAGFDAHVAKPATIETLEDVLSHFPAAARVGRA